MFEENIAANKQLIISMYPALSLKGVDNMLKFCWEDNGITTWIKSQYWGIEFGWLVGGWLRKTGFEYH